MCDEGFRERYPDAPAGYRERLEYEMSVVEKMGYVDYYLIVADFIRWAKEQGIPVKTGKCVMGGNARTVIADPGRCFMKVTAHAETGAILGAQLMCPNASDIIGQLGQAIANGMTPGQLLAAMRPHPTYEEALSEALESLAGKL